MNNKLTSLGINANHMEERITDREDRNTEVALAGVAQWIECQPANQRVTGSIPSLGHMPGLRVRSSVEGMQEGPTH